MSRPVVIVDTNVVVAGLLTADDTSPVARVLDGMLAAAFPFALSEALLAEYRAVLLRPRLKKLHGLPVADIESLLTDLAQHAIVLTPGAAPAARSSRSSNGGPRRTSRPRVGSSPRWGTTPAPTRSSCSR